MYLLDGALWTGRPAPRAALSLRPDESLFASLGFVGDTISELRAVRSCRDDPPPLLVAVADPNKRRHAVFFKSEEATLASAPDPVLMNATQRAALEGMCHTLEAVCGPPGTGALCV